MAPLSLFRFFFTTLGFLACSSLSSELGSRSSLENSMTILNLIYSFLFTPFLRFLLW
jgi:hypothetical protein